MAHTILEFDELNSTSDYLKENHDALSHMTFVKAGFQTQGRGQFERTWESNHHENLLCSVLLKPKLTQDIQDVKNKILHVVIDLLKSYQVHARYKAPNDLYTNNRKICGILIETKMDGKQTDYIIIGIGLNVNQTSFNAPNATSMCLEMNHMYDISMIFKKLVSHITSVL